MLLILISFFMTFTNAKIQLLQSDGVDNYTHFDPFNKRFKGIFEYSGCDPLAAKPNLTPEEIEAFSKKHLSIKQVNNEKLKELKAKLATPNLTDEEKKQIEIDAKKYNFGFKEFKNVKDCTSAQNANEPRTTHPSAVVVPFFDPAGETENCAPEKIIKKKFNVTIPMTNYMATIEKNNWKSNKIFFTDEFKSCLSNTLKENALCHMPPSKIKMNGLDLDKSNISELKVSDGKIHFGNHTVHYYDKDKKTWCTKFSFKEENIHGCHLSSTNQQPVEKILPIQISKQVDEKGVKVRKNINVGWIKLSPSGEAEIGASRSADSFEKNNANEVNKTKGFIKVLNILKEDTLATQVTSYDPQGKTLRKIEILPRHLLGVDLEQQSCPDGYCSPFSKKVTCKSIENNYLDMSAGGELCRSCRGNSTGLCGTTENKPKRFTKTFDEKYEKFCKNTPQPTEPTTSEN